MKKKILFLLLCSIVLGGTARTADLYVSTIQITEIESPKCNETTSFDVSLVSSQLTFF